MEDTPIPLEFSSPDSAVVMGATYDPGQQVIRVQIRNRVTGESDTYRGGGVPLELWLEFEAAQSKGSFFAKFIRPMFRLVKE